MLARVLDVLGEVVDVQVVVAAADQPLPEIDASAVVVRDRRESRGPLEGLAAGLASLPADVAAAYVTSCDVPLLKASFVARMFELLDDFDAVVPNCDGYHHPLAAVYRRELLTVVEELLAADRLRPIFILEACHARIVSKAEVSQSDAELDSLTNLNRPADYFAALDRAGFSCPDEVRAALS